MLFRGVSSEEQKVADMIQCQTSFASLYGNNTSHHAFMPTSIIPAINFTASCSNSLSTYLTHMLKQQKAIDKCGCYFTQQRPVHSLLYYICINMLSNPSLCLPHCHKIKHKRTYVWLTPLSSSCFDSLIALQRLLSRQCNQN